MARGANRNKGGLPRGAGWAILTLVLLCGALIVWQTWRTYTIRQIPDARQQLAELAAFYSTELRTGVGLLCVATIVFCVVVVVLYLRQRKELLKKLETLANDCEEMSPAEVLQLATAGLPDFKGIYLLHNLDKDKYYVGQSIHVLARMRQHFGGNGGNGDVYADYRGGDTFSVRTISLVSSGYDNLNALEADAIDLYEAFTKGYNRRRGNRA